MVIVYIQKKLSVHLILNLTASLLIWPYFIFHLQCLAQFVHKDGPKTTYFIIKCGSFVWVCVCLIVCIFVHESYEWQCCYVFRLHLCMQHVTGCYAWCGISMWSLRMAAMQIILHPSYMHIPEEFWRKLLPFFGI